MGQLERRKHVREDSVHLIYFEAPEDDYIGAPDGMGRTVNVSEGGLLLETAQPFDAGQEIYVTVGIEEQTILVKARVAHSVEQDSGVYQTGVEFLRIEPTAEQVLEQFIRRFRASRTP